MIDELLQTCSVKESMYSPNFDKICDTYVKYLVKRTDDDISFLQKLADLYFESANQKTAKCVETKFVYSQILSLIQKDYFAKYQNGLSDAINYQIHQKMLHTYGKNSNFLTINLPDSKVNFLLEQFSHKLNEYCKEQDGFEEVIKSVVADIDIDFLFKLYENIDRKKFVDMISLEPSIYPEPNLLSLMFSQGLLNYSI